MPCHPRNQHLARIELEPVLAHRTGHRRLELAHRLERTRLGKLPQPRVRLRQTLPHLVEALLALEVTNEAREVLALPLRVKVRVEQLGRDLDRGCPVHQADPALHERRGVLDALLRRLGHPRRQVLLSVLQGLREVEPEVAVFPQGLRHTRQERVSLHTCDVRGSVELAPAVPFDLNVRLVVPCQQRVPGEQLVEAVHQVVAAFDHSAAEVGLRHAVAQKPAHTHDGLVEPDRHIHEAEGPKAQTFPLEQLPPTLFEDIVADLFLDRTHDLQAPKPWVVSKCRHGVTIRLTELRALRNPLVQHLIARVVREPEHLLVLVQLGRHAINERLPARLVQVLDAGLATA